MSSFVIGVSDGFKSLLTSSVPNLEYDRMRISYLKFDSFAREIKCSDFEVDSDGG